MRGHSKGAVLSICNKDGGNVGTSNLEKDKTCGAEKSGKDWKSKDMRFKSSRYN